MTSPRIFLNDFAERSYFLVSVSYIENRSGPNMDPWGKPILAVLFFNNHVRL